MSLYLDPQYVEELYEDIVEACLRDKKIVAIVNSVFLKTRTLDLFLRHINSKNTQETKHFNLLFRNMVQEVLTRKIKQELFPEPTETQKLIWSSGSLDSLWSIKTEDLELIKDL
jgi:hypothetical protein